MKSRLITHLLGILRCGCISIALLAASAAAADWDEFNITLGEVVSEGVPGRGAGYVTGPDNSDHYYFKPPLGTLFRVKALAENCGLEWRCIGVHKYTTVFPTQPLCESQPPAFFVNGNEQGEEYEITVESKGKGAGTYSFVVEQINPIQTFDIELEQVISEGVPAAGAGIIGEFAEVDRYTFQGLAGQHIYLDRHAGDCFVQWRCLEVSGITWSLCSAPTLTLPHDGQYVVEIISLFGTTEPYSFSLNEVSPPQLFTIGIDQLVSQDVPEPGAGHIEEPGDIDLYALSIEQDTLLCFEQLTGSCNLRWMAWNVDENPVTFNDVFCGNQAGEQLLTGPAQYMIKVSMALDGDAGPYSFIIHPGKIGDIAPWKGDCRVDAVDLLAVIDNWGPCSGYWDCGADVTGDQTIDVDDLLAVINNWD